MRRCVPFLLSLGLIIFGCTANPPKDMITQISTIDALLAGVYDGEMTCGELMNYGSLGIGTFDALDGEMVIVENKIYQVKSDGNVCIPADSVRTPFAAVCEFVPEWTVALKDSMDYLALQNHLDTIITDHNLFYAVKIYGEFSFMHTRSVPAQTKPYPILAEVAKRQPEFQMRHVRGWVVGFRCPPYVKGLNVPGYHLHFLSEDVQQGGHILGFVLTAGVAEIDVCHRFTLILPKHVKDLQGLDLSVDRSHELEQVEK